MSITNQYDIRMNEKTLVLNQYFPFFLGTIANKWAATSSKIYLTEFGIGIAAWRVLASIYAKGESTSLEVVKHISMDPGAVSRAVNQLANEGHIEKVEGKFPGRTKPYVVSTSGRKLYKKIMRIALKREDQLLSGLSDQEKKTLLTSMHKVMKNLDDI